MQDEKDFEPEDSSELPRGMDLIHPVHWMHWTAGFGECWIFSRDISRLLFGLPFLLAAFSSVAFLWWLKYSPNDAVVQQLESAIQQAARAGDLAAQENHLLSLVALRPHDPEAIFRLGVFLTDHGRPEGLTHILGLAPERSAGFIPARLWLVAQAMQPEPYYRLDDVQIEAQLQRVLRDQPTQPDAHRWLADLYLRKEEWKLAEDHLMRAAMTRPELSVMVAKLKQSLNRDPADVAKYLKTGSDALLQLLSSSRDNVQVRISLAEAKFLQGEVQESRELLVSGLKQQDSAELRRALSDFDLTLAGQRLSQSVLNLEACVKLMLSVQQFDASNPALIQQLSRATTAGAKLTAQDVQPALQHWKAQTDAKPDDLESRLMLSQLLAMTGDSAEAAEVLRPMLPGHPELRLPMAQLLLKSNQIQEGQSIVDTIAAELRVQCQERPEDASAVAALGETLITASRAAETIELIRDYAKRMNREIVAIPELSEIHARACLLSYDSQISKTGDPAAAVAEADGEILMGLLVGATQCTSEPVISAALDRMARLAFSKHPVHVQAEKQLIAIQASGSQAGQGLVPLLMGTYAIQSKDYNQAVRYLEQANQLARGNDIRILNNLAVALVRADSKQPARALEMINTALSRFPDHADILSTRGEIYVVMEQWQQALADLTQALPARKDSRVLHSLLHQVYTELQNPQMAEEHKKSLERLDQNL